MAVTMRVRCSKCDNYRDLVKEPYPENPPKCPHCGSEVTAIDGTPFSKRVEELREAARKKEKEKAQIKEQMKTPMGLYGLIEKYLNEHEGVTKEPIYSEGLRGRLGLSRSNAVEYAKVERSYKNMRRVLLRLMKQYPDLNWPDMPPVEDNAEDGLVSIQKCCLDANKSAKSDLAAATSKTEPAPSVAKAYRSYQWLCKERPGLVPPEGAKKRYTIEMYDYVKNNSPEYHDEEGNPLKMPGFDSWTRNIRKYEQFLHGSKTSPRAGREQPKGTNLTQIQSLSDVTSKFDRE